MLLRYGDRQFIRNDLCPAFGRLDVQLGNAAADGFDVRGNFSRDAEYFYALFRCEARIFSWKNYSFLLFFSTVDQRKWNVSQVGNATKSISQLKMTISSFAV